MCIPVLHIKGVIKDSKEDTAMLWVGKVRVEVPSLINMYTLVTAQCSLCLTTYQLKTSTITVSSPIPTNVNMYSV